MRKLIWETPEETIMILASKIRRIRKRRKISQEDLSRMSDVSLGSLKRFESSGQISLISLVKIANALDIIEEIRNLFTNVEYLSIDEVLNDD